MTVRPMTYLSVLRPLGWPGALGAVCISLAVALTLFVEPQWDAQAAALQSQVDRLLKQQRLARLTAQNGPTADKPGSPQTWLRSLPPSSQRLPRLTDLLELGTREGLLVARTEHRVSTDAGSGLERLRISMSVKGSYSQVRAFIASALNADPALSLDGLKLRRSFVQATEIDADLQWSLHSRREGDT